MSFNAATSPSHEGKLPTRTSYAIADKIEQDEEDIQYFNECLAASHKVQAEQEAKVQRAENKLRDKASLGEEAPRLGNIRGEWTLYSSAFLDLIAEDIKTDEPEELENFVAGSVEISQDLIDGLVPRTFPDVGVEFSFTGVHNEGYQFDLRTPWSASLDPVKVNCCVIGNQRYLQIDVTFLGKGMLKIAFPGSEFCENYKGWGEIVFVGMQTKTGAG
ncbi:hypothetical protein EJ02DRAFT_458552 [Clathrospora elynae]|uniref:Uncharacterized protein n=1 Tax=Clathrospora elynae TaxID=706981 RepID=A0A6A5SCI4_9PLEO|nr:hypothetical protein EJ02DRAFT_458552 [Clathrospora elynae]